ncbi:DUF6371 domain-containing protein [Mucilaginibacter sp. McL0603]|uniref:DUF6371 domain-containing protein n=1 Tax=Mucilaginibacter sp. McL0603 TaxID=3415670 RepID=UPI003CF3F0E5
MTTLRYTLEPYNGPASRYHCPICNHRNKTFCRYIDTETDQYLADHVGRCSREDKCGYHYKPRHYFYANWMYKPQSTQKTYNVIRKTYNPSPPSYIHPDTVNASFTNYGQNYFVQYLITLFGFDKADELVGRYRIGTSNHWPGATIFWQLDTAGNVRTGKVMLYDKQTGKRVKEPFNHITWAHKLANLDVNFNLKQCLFGEHLLNEEPTKPVAIVESEKTAIIASALLPDMLWLAAGSLHNLKFEICQALKGRKVYLFPDLNAYDKWRIKALSIQTQMPGTTFKVFKAMEHKANEDELKQGLDLGDLLGRG